MSSFYLASTPYHLLLALADAEREGGPSTIFFFGAFPSAAAYLETLRSSPALLPELKVDGLAGSAKSSSLRRKARSSLLESLRRADASRVAVFNDRHDLSQLALARAALRPKTHRICIEDGSSFYTQWLAPPASKWTQLRKRYFTAPSWTPNRVLGTHPLVQELRALRPEVLRPELKSRALRLDVDLLRSPVLGRFAQRLTNTLRSDGQRIELPPCPQALLAPPLESTATWAESARPWVVGIKDVAIKHHPRQAHLDPGNLLELGIEISRHLPLELLYLQWGRAPDLLVGDGQSTALLSTRLFDAQARVVGLCRDALPQHASVYEQLDIELHCAGDAIGVVDGN